MFSPGQDFLVPLDIYCLAAPLIFSNHNDTTICIYATSHGTPGTLDTVRNIFCDIVIRVPRWANITAAMSVELDVQMGTTLVRDGNQT